MTDAQKRALSALYEHWGVNPPVVSLDLPALFGRAAPTVLEIGFGDGDSLAQMAMEAPEKNFLGVEVHRPGVGRLLNRLETESIANVRVACHDALEVLRDWLAPQSLDAIHLFFPDPWPKKRHHKRRMVQPAWVDLAASRLRPLGILHMATDWEDYAEHMHNVMADAPLFENIHGDQNFAPDRHGRPPTKFERRGVRKGHQVRDLVYQRRG
ncbi:tRNA (guanine-N7-)-methyltransferase [Natronocella acetinitrilica]|uniref:tRNA (guanine-N(7)-)-methyltransferase n=1 Tax=Natronocella acetinitrilica TaxID=414046 RepID=A0AAE3G180_9GAMM|nr:tRNA (guanosine(46)-N7)-methyltransferase TrmB [Natronocella acetinitrilica]MCP1673094.1 tRNA (guanine-N7-)-methyltransferase [Natronocella acetinitrilica]